MSNDKTTSAGAAGKVPLSPSKSRANKTVKASRPIRAEAAVTYEPPVLASAATDQERTVQKKQLFLMNYAKGVSETTAAIMTGIARGTVTEWKGKDPSFLAALKDAESAGLDLIEDRVLAASARDWRAGVAILEVKRSDVWGRKVRNYNVNEDGPRKAAATAEDRARTLELLERLGLAAAAARNGADQEREGEEQFPGLRDLDRRSGSAN